MKRGEAILEMNNQPEYASSLDFSDGGGQPDNADIQKAVASTVTPLTDGGGHLARDTHNERAHAVTPLTEGGQTRTANTHGLCAPFHPIDGGHIESANTHASCADINPICDQLRELHRQRQDLHRAEKSLTLQIKAKCRRLCAGDKKEADKLYASMLNGQEHPQSMIAFAVSIPFIQSRTLLEKERKSTEKQMEKWAKQLPVAPFIESTKGVGYGSLAALVGECGNLSNYSTVSKLWKRLGLGLIGDIRQQKKSGADGILHGYSPSRRSVSWNVAASLFKSQSKDKLYFRQVYDERKEYELQRVETKGHAHNRAMRYMEKRFIRELWKAWRDCGHLLFDNHGEDAA